MEVQLKRSWKHEIFRTYIEKPVFSRHGLCGRSTWNVRSIVMKSFILTLVACLVCASAYAGGSFDFADQLLPLLEEQPKLKEYLLSTLDIAPQGYACRIGSTVNAHLGGKRIGPYVLKAKPKGVIGDYTLELTFHTEKKYFDANDKVSNLALGVKVLEKLKWVEIKMLSKAASNKALEGGSQLLAPQGRH
jgi:hypothetical protein